jgi:hypothetical protein
MSLEQILGLSPERKSEKTASTNSSLSDLLDKAVTAAETEKTASVNEEHPVDRLEKMASEIANQDRAELLKFGSLYGRAIGAGFLAELQDYQVAAEKVASEQEAQAAYQQSQLEKFAQENPQEFEAAVAAGYNSKRAALEKEAEEDFKQGYNDAVQYIHKQAYDYFAYGYNAMDEVIQRFSQK